MFGGEVEGAAGVEVVDSVEWYDGCPVVAAFGGGVLHVYVAVLCYLHDGGVAFEDGFFAFVEASPGYDGGLLVESSVVLDVVPAYHGFAVFFNDGFYSFDEVAHELVYVCHAFFFH